MEKFGLKFKTCSWWKITKGLKKLKKLEKLKNSKKDWKDWEKVENKNAKKKRIQKCNEEQINRTELNIIKRYK